MNVVIIDSGLSKKMLHNVYFGITIKKENGIIKVIKDSFFDDIGHGTAVTQLFLNRVNTEQKKLRLYIIKLENNSKIGYDLECLLFALDYINININCDMLIISSGIRTYNDELYRKLKLINLKETIIFSAFDNFGSMSYPAAFDFVIGVDTSDVININSDSFIAILNNPINIITKKKFYRIKWINDKTNIVKGSSFSCGEIAGEFANYFMKNKEDNPNKVFFNFIEEYSDIVVQNRNKNIGDISHCKKAVVFPFNKEIHALACNEDILTLDIHDYYDVRQSGKVGIEINKLLKHCNNNKIIKNIEDLNWKDDFDTFILGHSKQLEKIISYDIKNYIIENCKKYNKFLISFDGLENDQIDLDCYYPHIDKSDVPIYNYGKMYLTDTPILGVFGTSSTQGKFSLQLMLRRLFIQNDYNVSQIGSEPSSLLFGIDYTFPMGFNSTVSTKSNDNIILLNKFIHDCDTKSPDIIIVGSQSGTCPYNIFNLSLFTLPQIEFLLGTQPDVVVLTVNVNDDINYVKRTIYSIEGIVDCKVVAIVLYPRKMTGNIEMISSAVTDEGYILYKKAIEEKFNIPVYSFDESEINSLFQYVIDYLST